MQNTIAPQRHPRPLTGRTVLVCFIVFFGTVFAVNAIMVRAATTTFGGVETESSYKAGLNFKNDVASAEAQDALHWKVEAILVGDGVKTRMTVTARDADSRPLGGLTIDARLHHPTDKRRDVALDVADFAPGQFQFATPLPPGQWDLMIGLKRGEETVFQSRSRITVKSL
ncbi:FixH family protein [Microvirga sp. 2MCAF38]|uniref:FixH family protein n=1 Tax=Microvirga sp. 2MCAF38 TaxID=3232989 RepID=UPI003F9A7B56